MTEAGFGSAADFPPCSLDLTLIENVFGIMVEHQQPHDHVNAHDTQEQKEQHARASHLNSNESLTAIMV